MSTKTKKKKKVNYEFTLSNPVTGGYAAFKIKGKPMVVPEPVFAVEVLIQVTRHERKRAEKAEGLNKIYGAVIKSMLEQRAKMVDLRKKNSKPKKQK